MADRPDPFEAQLDGMMALPVEERLAHALALFRRERDRLRAELNHFCWKEGRRGDGVAVIPGLNETLTALVRRFAACGLVRHDDVDDLYRHVSALRKWLAQAAPAVVIATLKEEGYEVVAGFDDLYRLLRGGDPDAAQARRRAPGFSIHQSAILFHLATHGSAHVEQFSCLPRHISNIRAVLAQQGVADIIVIEVRAGDGIYVVSKGREDLRRFMCGEPVVQPKPTEAPQPTRQGELDLECVA